MEKKVSFAFFVLLILFFSFSVWAQEFPTPNMVIVDSIYDAGEVQEGKALEHSFTILNTGDSVLEIRDVKPG